MSAGLLILIFTALRSAELKQRQRLKLSDSIGSEPSEKRTEHDRAAISFNEDSSSTTPSPRLVPSPRLANILV